MQKIVLVRHGQSQWNLENRFTGWMDVGLSERGIVEAREAGRALKREGYTFDVALVSYLKRAIRTLWLIEEELDQMWLPVMTDWRLNERHYGALQGLNKRETVERHGAEQVQQWRRGYTVRPPALAADHAMHPGRDPRYRQLANPPATESLADTLERVVHWWDDTVLPLLKAGRQPLIVAHGNSLRALMKHLDGLNEAEVMALNIPTGLSLVYELDDTGRPLRHYYLADPEQVAAAENEVHKQTG